MSLGAVKLYRNRDPGTDRARMSGSCFFNVHAWREFLEVLPAHELYKNNVPLCRVIDILLWQLDRLCGEVNEQLTVGSTEFFTVDFTESFLLVCKASWDLRFGSWLRSQFTPSPETLDPEGPDHTFIQLNLLGYFAASLAMADILIGDEIDRLDKAKCILSGAVDHYGPGPCLERLRRCAESMRDLKSVDHQLQNLKDLPMYQDLAAVAKIKSQRLYNQIKTALANETGLNAEPTAYLPDDSQTSATARTDQTSSLPSRSYSSATTTSNSTREQRRSPKFKAIETLQEYKDLLSYFNFAKMAAIKEADKLDAFVNTWRMLFEQAGISLKRKYHYLDGALDHCGSITNSYF